MLMASESGRQKQRSCGRPRSQSAPALFVTNLVKKQKLWMNDSICAAIEAVKNGTSIY